MNVKIVFDPYEKEYIAFVEGCKFAGYGTTEELAVVHFLRKCEGNSKFNQTVVSNLLLKLNQ